VRDQPWPSTVDLDSRWPGGHARLRASCGWWKTTDDYRHLVGITMRQPERGTEVVWITFAHPLRGLADGEDAAIYATLGFNRHKDSEEHTRWLQWRRAIREQAHLAGLPRPTPATVELCRIATPPMAVLPSAKEALQRLARLALIKLVVLGRDDPQALDGAGPFAPDTA